MLLLLLCLFQSPNESERELIVEPLRAQAYTQLGSMVVTVPENMLYVKDEGIAPMIELTGATYIPNCSGLFFSAKDDWSFSAIVQFFPYQKYDFTPQVEPSFFKACFSGSHFYYGTSITEEPEVLVPPTLNAEAQTFTLGYAYKPTDDHKKSVCIKKIFRNDQDTILLTIVAKDKESYLRNKPEIDAIQESIQYSGEPIEPLPMAGLSYLKLLGLGGLVDGNEVAYLPTHIIVISIVLGIFGITLVVFAVRLAKKQAAASTDATEPDPPPPTDHAETNGT